jgi:hypothetical protein
MTSSAHPSRLWVICTVVAIVAMVAPPIRAAGGGGSAALATELTSLLTDRHLDSIAAQDPEAANRFIAALLIPDAQLLVVSADYPAPAELQAQLTQKNYRDVYAALHQPASLQTRLFFIDAGCDGLKSGADTVDVLYERGKQTMFDGHWKQQGLSEAAYTKKVGESDEQYAKMLTVLLTALKAPAASAAR